MGESRVLHPSGDVGRRTGWGMLPLFAVSVAGVWAVERYTGRWWGSWRHLAAALPAFYAVMSGAIVGLFLATEVSLVLTDSHLVLRRPWSRRRWAWSGLRDVQVVEDGTVRVLVLAPLGGTAVLLPGPFREDGGAFCGQAGRLDRLAGELRTALRTHRPEQEPLDALDADALRVLAEEASAGLRAAGRRGARRRRWLWRPAVVLVVGYGLAANGFRIAEAASSGKPWQQSAPLALNCLLLLLTLSTLRPWFGRLSGGRFGGRRRRRG